MLKIDKEHPRKDGTGAVFFQLLINRKKERIGLGFSWPINRFNESAGCLPRMKQDPDVDAFNVVIDNVRTKANDIRKEYMIKGSPLTLDVFRKEFYSNMNKNDFISYFEKKSFERWNKNAISNHTYRLEKTVIGKVKRFAAQVMSSDQILFSEFTYAWAPLFDRFLRDKDKLAPNSRWGTHKIVITYLNIAADIDKIVFDDPYARFSNKTAEGSWGPLTAEDLAMLTGVYNKWKANPLPVVPRENGKHKTDNREGLTAAEVIVLRKFLFSCNSALRVSDMQKLDISLFNDGKMSITPHKTETYGTRIKDIPLSDVAKALLQDEINFVRQQKSDKPYLKIQRMKDTSRIFEAYKDQSCNRILKRIARKMKLDHKLHMHVGRFTYGSLMDEAGANHTALMKQMGIRKRETLNKYVKTNAKRIEDNVDRFNKLVANSNAKSGETHSI